MNGFRNTTPPMHSYKVFRSNGAVLPSIRKLERVCITAPTPDVLWFVES